MSRKRVLSSLATVLLVFSLSACTPVASSGGSTRATSADTPDLLDACAGRLIFIPEEWSVTFKDYASDPVNPSAIQASKDVLLSLLTYSEPWYRDCLAKALQENPDLETQVGILGWAPKEFSDLFLKQLAALNEGRYNAAAAVENEIDTVLVMVLSALQTPKEN